MKRLVPPTGQQDVESSGWDERPEDSDLTVPQVQSMASDVVIHHSVLPWNKFILWKKRVEFPHQVNP